jgi:hypothetical protein
MNIKAGWNRFFFSESSYFDLAFIRLIIVTFSLYWLFDYSFSHIVTAQALNAHFFSPIPVLNIFLLPLYGWGAMPPESFVLSVFWLTVFVGVLALVGVLTNVSMMLFALGNIFLQAYIYSFGDPHHREAIMNVTLLMFALAPCGKVLSVDCYLRQRRRRGSVSLSGEALLDYKGPYAGWPIKMMQCFFALMYLSAVSSKMSVSGLGWANGYTLQYYLAMDHFRKGGIELGLWVSQFHYFILALQWVVLLFQATFLLIIFFPKLRWIYLPIGLMFHTGIHLTMHASFPQWILLYALFVPWSAGFTWVANATVFTRTHSLETQGAKHG